MSREEKPSRAQRLLDAAREAAELRAFRTHPDVAALRIEQVRVAVDVLVWSGIVLGLLFTMSNVAAFAAQGAPAWSVAWVIAWLLDPMVSLCLIAVLIAESVLARHQIESSRWVRFARLMLLAATFVMNTWTAWAALDAALIVLHSVPPLVVCVMAEAITDLRYKLTEAVLAAHRYAAARLQNPADLEGTGPPLAAAPDESPPAQDGATKDDAVAGSHWRAPRQPDHDTEPGPGHLSEPAVRSTPRLTYRATRTTKDASTDHDTVPGPGYLSEPAVRSTPGPAHWTTREALADPDRRGAAPEAQESAPAVANRSHTPVRAARTGTDPVRVTHAADQMTEAVREYRTSLEIGAPLSERKLAERFGQSRRWARKVIDTARGEPRLVLASSDTAGGEK